MTFSCLRREPKQLRSRERVDLILNTAADLLAEAGPDAVTITAVAERSGLATSSVYDYVEDDRNLIGAVAERALDLLHRDMVEIIGAPETVEALAASLSLGMQRFLSRYQNDAGLREALAFVDADPSLMHLNLDDTRRNAAFIETAAARIWPNAEFGSAIFMMVHLSGALASLAARLEADEAAEVIAQFERLFLLTLAEGADAATS